MTRLRQLGKDSIIYGLGGAFAKAIGLLMLPVYTRLFSPEDYGLIEMLAVVGGLLSIVLTMGMDAAQSFYFFQKRDGGTAQRAALISAILQWRLIWGTLIVSVATIIAPPLTSTLFGNQLGWLHFAVAFASALASQLLAQSIEVFRLLYRPWPYVLITLTHTLLAAGSIVLLVVSFDRGILGYFLGAMIASVAMAAFSWTLVRKYLDFRQLHRYWWPTLLRFGMPLLPAGLAMYFMNSTDRWFIQHYHGAATLGVYAVGAKIAMMMALAVETFRKAWWPIAMDAMHSEDGPETYRMIGRLFTGIGVAGIVYLCFLSPLIVETLVAPSFNDAWPIIGILAWQSLFYGFYSIASGGIWKTESTRYTVYLMGSAALLNILLNYLLVPEHGETGAALATSISFFAWILATLALSERLWRVNYEMGVMLAQLSLGVLVVIWLIARGGIYDASAVTLTHSAVIVLLASSLTTRRWRNIFMSIPKT